MTTNKIPNKEVYATIKVLIDAGHAKVAHWSSNTTTGIPGVLVMQSDDNLVIYQNGVGRWSSNTAGYYISYAVKK